MSKNSKLKDPTFKLKPACAAVLLAFGIQQVEANPLGGSVVSGQASFNTTGNILTVSNTPGAIINWQDFSIQQNEITRFAQQSASSAVLNRVISNNPSQILGSLQSNGRVFLVNPNGIVFGAGSTVDVAGLVATSLNLSDADFIAGRHRFSNPSPTGAGEGVSNAGTLTTQSGGEIYLIAPNVQNSGLISAPNGDILLAAGNSVELVNSLDPNLRVNITAAGTTTNVGQLVASAGKLGLFGTVVKNTGTVSANSATLQGGRIVFKASQRSEAGGVISARGAGGGEIKILADMQTGTVDVTGTLDASALPSASVPAPAGGGPGWGNGGFIDTSAAHVHVADSARVTAAAPNGKAGTWLIDPTDYTIAAVDPLNGSSYMSNTTLATSLGSSNITIQTSATGTGNGDLIINDAVSWNSANSLTLNAIRNVNINAAISNNGTGNLIVRADLNGSNTGDILFGGGVVALTGGGRADLYYNPIIYTTPFNFAAGMGSTTYTAWMLVNDDVHLQAMNTNLAGNYALGKNIDATATSAWNTGAGFAPIGNAATAFTGSFNGQGNTISHLTINRPLENEVGLFGYLGAGSVVSNAGLLNASVLGGSNVGALAGWNSNATINSVTVRSSANGVTTVTGTNNVGGLAGKNSGGIINTYVNGGTVSGSSRVGGLVGSNDSNGTISFSYASNGAVTGGLNSTGGVVGYNAGSVHDNFWDTSLNTGGNLSTGIGWDVANLFPTDYGAIALPTYAFMLQGSFANYFDRPTAVFNSWNFGSTGGTWWMVDGYTRPFLRSEWSASITNAHQLQMMDMNPTASYTLSNTLDLAAELNNMDSTGMWSNAGFVPIGNVTQFTGTFDGLNHVISNLKINRTGASVGLFGDVGMGGTVSNVSLVNANVVGGFNVGGLAGYNLGAIGNSSVRTSVVSGNGSSGIGGLVGNNVGGISNSFVSGGSVNGGNWTAGGLVGQNVGSINASYVTGGTVISGGGNLVGGGVGGLVGNNNTGNILGSYVSGASVKSVVSTDPLYPGQASYAGGLVGQSFGGTISGSYVSNVAVTGVADVGGLVGNNRSIVRDSYVSGSTILGATNVGGLVGYNASKSTTLPAGYVGDISNTYVSGGMVMGTPNSTGGLVGLNDSFNGALVSNSYWNLITTGGGPVSGIGNDTAGIGGGSDAGAARLTPAQMQQQSSFTAWDFVNTWRSYNGHSAPLLKSFLTPVSVMASGITGNFNKTYDAVAWKAPALGTLTYSVQSAAGLLHELTPFGAPVIDAGLYEMLWSDQQGYDISYTAGGLLTINAATVNVLGISANNATKSYGSPFNFPGNAFTAVGLLGSDSISSVTLTSDGAVAEAIVGEYAITPSAAVFGVGNASNYSITYADGVLTVNPVTLTYTANSASRIYGANDPAFDGTVTGFVLGQNLNTATTGAATLSFTSNATNNSNVGSYAITGSGLTANNGNYVFVQAAGNANAFTITPATLTYTANVASRIYGETNPAFTGAVTGFVLGEIESTATTGTKSFGTSVLNTSNVGSYAINGSGLSANNGNYVFAQAASNGTAFSIIQRIISVTADAASKVYGDADPGTYSVGGAGLASFDTKASVFSGALGHSGGENQNVVGVQTAPYAITQGSLVANSNYSISGFTANNLTITQAPLTVQANSPSKFLGTNDPLLTYRVSGLKFSDTASATLSGVLGRESGDIIGTYAITQGSLDLLSSNYALNFVPGTMRILAPTVLQEITQISMRMGTPEPALGDPCDKEKEREVAAKLAAVSEISNKVNGGLAEILPVCR